MSDRELLEAAARAYWGNEIGDVCSIEWDDDAQCIAYTHADNQDHNGNDQAFLWNPIADDGDALRLAVKLRIDILTEDDGDGLIGTLLPDGKQGPSIQIDGDPYAATRRAITRAAAAIGGHHG